MLRTYTTACRVPLPADSGKVVGYLTCRHIITEFFIGSWLFLVGVNLWHPGTASHLHTLMVDAGSAVGVTISNRDQRSLAGVWNLCCGEEKNRCRLPGMRNFQLSLNFFLCRLQFNATQESLQSSASVGFRLLVYK